MPRLITLRRATLAALAVLAAGCSGPKDRTAPATVDEAADPDAVVPRGGGPDPSPRPALPPASPSAGEPEVEAVTASVTGKVQVYYRVGGILYGTHHLLSVDHQPDGRYTLSARTGKAAVLDNVQPGGWTDAGRWSVARSGGRVGLHYQSDGGGVVYLPVQVAAGGEVQLLADGLPGGTERYWMVRGWPYWLNTNIVPPEITLDRQ